LNEANTSIFNFLASCSISCRNCLVLLTSIAGDLGGSQPLLFSVISAIEWTPDIGCHAVTIESVDLRRFLEINLNKGCFDLVQANKKQKKELPDEKSIRPDHCCSDPNSAAGC
jgi:hypothetical protein